MFCYCFVGALYDSFILNWIFFAEMCWKRIDISWMIVGNYISCTKSNFYEIVNFFTNFLSQQLSVRRDFWAGLAWLWNGWATRGVDCFNQTTTNATIPLYKFPSLSTPDWYWSSIPEVHYGSAHLLTIS